MIAATSSDETCSHFSSQDVQGSYLNARYYLNKKNNLFYYYWFNIIYCTVLVYFRGPWTKYLNVMAVLEMLSLQIANMNSLT